MAKLFASEAAHRAADKAMQILASDGYRRGSVVERLFRDVRATEIYQGTSEVQRMVIAEHIIANRGLGPNLGSRRSRSHLAPHRSSRSSCAHLLKLVSLDQPSSCLAIVCSCRLDVPS